MVGLDDAIKEFLIESHENLDRLDRDLVVLERNPGHPDSLASIFRTVHTIKGTCGFFNFNRLGSLTHAGESLLSQLRDGKRLLDSLTMNELLALVDTVRKMLHSIEQTGQEGNDDHAELTARIAALARGEQLAAAASRIPEQPDETGDGASNLADSTIRVDVTQLDRLMDLVGELVLARNQIVQFTALQKDTTFQNMSQRLNLITTELQEGVMKTRMQPIAAVWNKFPRLCRDLGAACGKKVSLMLEGQETELDKSIIEAIKDPLTHLIRNAIDHGLEAPEERRALGKPPEGRLRVHAFHEGGQVNIEVHDDGAGIDPQRVRLKAIDRGLLSADQGAALNDHEVLQLIFLPGFSTAAAVTSISGRGVGMDVVKTNIEKISGSVDLLSTVGQGTTVRLKIPLTLAIIPVLLVTCAGDRFAIPQASLLELVRIEVEDAPRQIEDIRGARVHRLRGKLLPLIDLREVLALGPGPSRNEAINVVVLQADERRFGLVVDAVNDMEEIVVKPLGKQLKSIPIYAGATILGDGRVALILDVHELAQGAGVLDGSRERIAAEPVEDARPCRALLLVGAGRDRRFAVPLAQVARLEEVPQAALENSGGDEVVQYRGRILTVWRLTRLLGLPDDPPSTGERWPLVVCSRGEQTVGIVVERIIDVVETAVEPERRASEIPGLCGRMVIQGRVTELLDPVRFLEAAAAFAPMGA